MDLKEIHPSKVFGEKWVDYACELKKAANQDEFCDVLFRISENRNITIGDAAVIFSKALFSDETFYKILIRRDAIVLSSVFESLQTQRQK